MKCAAFVDFFLKRYAESIESDLKLQVDVFRHFLTVGLQQFDGIFQWVKHFISGSLAVLHGHHVTHYLHQTRVVALLDWLIKSRVRRLNEVVQIFQAVNKHKTNRRRPPTCDS